MPVVSLEPLHRFHCYSARFPSEIAESAISELTGPGDSVCDPFCGSGTTLVAGLAAGRSVVGSDIDVLAGMLSELKCGPYPARKYAVWKDRFVPRLEKQLDHVRDSWAGVSRPKPGETWSVGDLGLFVPDLDNLPYWFPPQVIGALAAISDLAHKCRDAHYERLILIALSACIVSKWPKTLSYAMDIDHTRPHRRVQKISLDKVRNTFLARLDRCISCLGQLHQVYEESGVDYRSQAEVIYPRDAREPASTPPDESQDLIVTSPPYFNAVDYPRAHRLSVCWMNGHAPEELVSRKKYIGLRYAPGFGYEGWLKKRPDIRKRLPKPIREDSSLGKRVCAFFADLDDVLHENWRVLRPGGHAVYVIANNVIKSERIASHLVLADLAKAIGFSVVRSNRRQIAQLRRRFPVGPFGFDGPMTHEFVVVLKKPRGSR